MDSNYASVVVAAKRARQINSYYHNLGEGTFDEFPPPMVDTGSKNYLTIALEEVAAGKISYLPLGRAEGVRLPSARTGGAALSATHSLGVSGGVAAYKALELVRLATGAGHAVRVIQTPASLRFVGARSFAAFTGAPVLTDEYRARPGARRLSRRPRRRRTVPLRTWSWCATPTCS